LLTAPASVQDVLRQTGIIVAAGTALQLAWGEKPPDHQLIDISALSEARGIACLNGGLRIGALETLEACRTHHLVQHHAGLLAQACTVIGALGVRNLATLGGNICWRQGDTIPALLVLGARVETAAGVMMLTDMLARPTLPLLLAVHIPRPEDESLTVFEKIGHRAAFSPSVATIAGWCRRGADGRVTHARLAAGGAGRPGQLQHEAADMLIGADPDDEMLWQRIAASSGGVAGRVLSGRLREALRR
jgi:carbon-monoxide dehydrogenase medium subunit